MKLEIPGNGGTFSTGWLGLVTKESVQIALTYIRSYASELGLANSFYLGKDLHLHLLEGAISKDGPSFGIAIVTALVSALTKNPVKSKLAMTGEITLQGRVLPVGGLEEKLLAVKQHNLTTVILPQENFDDVKKIKQETDDLDGLEFIFVSSINEGLSAALIRDPFKKDKKKLVNQKNNFIYSWLKYFRLMPKFVHS